MVSLLKNSMVMWGTAFLVGGGVLFFLFSEPLDLLFDLETIQKTIEETGAFGPIIIIVSIALAVVFSPIPSAPLTALSGAAYGHFWGAAYALIGAQIGAMIAFFIARKLGSKPIGKIVKKFELPTGISSQNGLTFSILIARLIPAISFDIVSYLAGLSAITSIRFFVATLIGMVPMTFLFSHVGNEFAWGNGGLAGWGALSGGIILIVAGSMYTKMRRKKNQLQVSKQEKVDVSTFKQKKEVV